jgi:hypothetical protein
MDEPWGARVIRRLEEHRGPFSPVRTVGQNVTVAMNK